MIRRILLSLALMGLACAPAVADFTFTQGSTTTAKSFTCETTKQCFASVPINSSGTEIFTVANPAVVSAVGVTQGSSTGGQSLSPVGYAVLSAVPTYSNATTNLPTLTTRGSQRIDVDTLAGTAVSTNSGNVGAGTMRVVLATDQPSLTNSQPIVGKLSTSGGWSEKLLNGLSTTVTAIKSSAAGQLGMVYCYNPNASAAYIQVFDVATAGAVTLGTTVPVLSFGIPATNASGSGPTLVGAQFANGIQVAATTTVNGSSAPGTALDCNATFN